MWHWTLAELAGQAGACSGWGRPLGGMLRQAHTSGENSSLVRGRAESLPFRSQSFDRIFSINAFHHFSDKIASIEEARRVLGPKGAFLTLGLDPHTGRDKWWVYDYFDQTLEIDKRRYPPASEIRAWMERAGFGSCATREVQHLPSEITAESAEQSGMLEASSTSQLTVLKEDEYQRGMNRLRKDMDAARERGEQLLLAADLRLYATIGWAE